MPAFFTADPHFGHANIIRYCGRPFADAAAMDAAILANVNAVVGPGDTLWLLGDFSHGHWANDEYLRRCAGWRSRIVCADIRLVVGNHDRAYLPEFRGLFSEVHDLAEARACGERVVLCHYAMRAWNHSHHGSWHLFGHTHGRLEDDPRLLAFDAGVDCWGFRPLGEREVADEMDRRKRRRAELA